MSNELNIRPAQESDVPAITAIYNEAILTTTATFDIDEQPVESRLAWFRNRTDDLPVFVAEWDEHVVAYASLGYWSDKKAYDVAAEFSLYVESGLRGCGIGRALAEHLLEAAKATRLYTIISRVTADNTVSIRLHEQLGFTEIGVMRRCGRKFGTILDVVFLQKILK